MFKHGKHTPEHEGAEPEKDTLLASQKAKGDVDVLSSSPIASLTPTQPTDMRTLKELLEKNLKWSQIIYEQNRKINHKLLLSAVGSWIHAFIILVPLVLGALLVPQLIRDYNCLAKNVGCGQNTKAAWNNVIKYLPLDNTQRQELQNIVK